MSSLLFLCALAALRETLLDVRRQEDAVGLAGEVAVPRRQAGEGFGGQDAVPARGAGISTTALSVSTSTSG